MPTDRQTVLIFANPISGRGQGPAIARRLQHRLEAEGFAVRTSTTHPAKLRSDELDPSARAAIVIGGDGTLRAIAERLLREGTTIPPLLPVPLGTANLMVRFLGVSGKANTLEQRVSAAVHRHKVLQLDAGKANDRLFLLMAGVGFDARVVYELDRLRNGPIRLWDYILPAALTLRAYDYPPLRVALDGSEIFGEAPAIAFVGNLAEYGTGFPVLPYARPDDGLLDVCVMPCESTPDLIDLFLRAAAGEHTRVEGVVYRKGRSVRIESSRPVRVQVDGDPAGLTPVQLDLLPVRLPFIVSV